MRALDHPLLADENIHPDVVGALRRQGKDVRSVAQEGLQGKADREILSRAHAGGRVVLTHDGDFGSLAVRDGEPYTGIIYVRPGHASPDFVVRLLASVEEIDVMAEPPFLLVAEHRLGIVRVRIRRPA